MIDTLKMPWPWYVAGALIGLVVPALLLLGNKKFGLSANFRHICAACFPAGIDFFRYDWKKERWNLFFLFGIIIGSIIATTLLADPNPLVVEPALLSELETYGLKDHARLLPNEIFNFGSLLTIRGFVLLVAGGFLVGFGTRYAGGCTSGHAIMGLSDLQWPSLVATISFMAGGFIMANFLLPIIMKL